MKKEQPKSLLEMLAELESHLELIDAKMRQCIAGQKKIKEFI